MMSNKYALVAALALLCGAEARAQQVEADSELARAVADCNAMAAVDKVKQRSVRACEKLADDGRLSLVEPAAAAAYLRHQQQRLEACQARRASPRGMARGDSRCASSATSPER